MIEIITLYLLIYFQLFMSHAGAHTHTGFIYIYIFTTTGGFRFSFFFVFNFFSISRSHYRLFRTFPLTPLATHTHVLYYMCVSLFVIYVYFLFNTCT